MIRRIGDVCTNPEHALSGEMTFEPGNYEHECPGCKCKTMFAVYSRTPITFTKKVIVHQNWNSDETRRS
jgi:hypothetical protein